jgi:diguanylate cyclase (GGDEF)-like protein
MGRWTGPKVSASLRLHTAREKQLAIDEGELRGDHGDNDLRQEVRELRDRLTNVEGHFRGVVDNSTDGVVVVNRDGIVVFANTAAAVMLGKTRAQLIGKAASFPVVSTTSRRPDNEAILADMRLLSTDWDDEPAVLALMRDITERSMADAEMAYRATHDPVTGLPNRYLLDDRLRQALARDRREPKTLGVLFCDVDGLKGINDRLGHAVGDAVLQAFAGTAIATLGVDILFARIGGEEFASCIPVGDIDEAYAIADRVRRNFAAAAVRYGKDQLAPTVSVGVTLGCDPHASVPEMLAIVDRALYRAKELGRNRVETAMPSADEATVGAPSIVPIIGPDRAGAVAQSMIRRWRAAS